MSIGIIEKQILYDNPYAPIVKFSYSNNLDEDDMTDDQISSGDTLLHDLVKSFDTTINTCFSDQQIESNDISQVDLVTKSNTWSDLIEHLRTSLRTDLKLPHTAKNCQTAMNSIYEKEFLLIDDLNEEEEDELREQLDMHSVIISSNTLIHEPFVTAEQVISEIDFILQDMTPDSGYCDDLHTSRICNNDFKKQSSYSLNQFYEELNKSIKDLSNILVHELAIRDGLDYEKETKNTFISLVHSIQNKRQHYQNEKHRSIIGNIKSNEPKTYLTTVIPFDCEHQAYLSVDYLQNLNKILQAINADSSQVPELLTNYILKVLCPC